MKNKEVLENVIKTIKNEIRDKQRILNLFEKVYRLFKEKDEKDITETDYQEIIDNLVSEYIRNISKDDLLNNISKNQDS
jgi:RNA binding exosome subunit